MAALTPAGELAANNPIRHPNESEDYRRARQELLVEEIELRRRAERVASLRRDRRPVVRSPMTTTSWPRTAPIVPVGPVR